MLIGVETRGRRENKEKEKMTKKYRRKMIPRNKTDHIRLSSNIAENLPVLSLKTLS